MAEEEKTTVDEVEVKGVEGEGQKVTPFAIDYEISEGEKYRTIINAPSPDLALQEFVKIASAPTHVLALRLEEQQTDKVVPVLLKLNAFDKISVVQLGVAQIPDVVPEAAPAEEQEQ